MAILYRVRAYPFEKEDMIYETFESKEEAEAYWTQLQTENSDVFEKVPYETVVIKIEEIRYGTWVPMSVRTVVR